jgi:hypothetical protein
MPVALSFFPLLQKQGFRSPCGRAAHFSLLRQRKVSKRKATPMPRSPRYALRVRDRIPGFVECTSIYMQRTGALPARHSIELSSMRSPRQEGTRDQVQSRSAASFLIPPLILGPLHRAEHRRQRGKMPAGSRRWIAAIAKKCMDALSEQPRAAEKRRGPRAQREARCRGCVSFGDFSLHKQRKVTRSPQASGSFVCKPVKKSWAAALAGMTSNSGGSPCAG